MSKDKTTGTESRKRKHIGTVILAWLVVIAIIALFAFIGAKVFLKLGYNSLKNKATTSGPSLAAEEEGGLFTGATEVEGVIWQDNWIGYDGKVYEYNENIFNFLVLGIDKKTGIAEETADKTGGGQADAIFLAVFNPDTHQIKLVGINRDTMVDVVAVGMGENGEDIIIEAEIAIQHGFGGGGSYSCELTRDRVSELFYGLPIHGYLSFQLNGIVALNDKLGGVTLTALEDMNFKDLQCKKGDEITLLGQTAYRYVQGRDTSQFESARNRLARQKQYLSKLGKLTFEKMKKDVTLPLQLYTEFKDYIVTDFTVDEISWLASELTKYDFDSNAIYTLEGTTVTGEQFEEFTPDQEALKKLMIELFYKEVNISQ